MILKVENLNIYAVQNGQNIRVVKNLHFHIQEGECLGIVGESGSGKSLTAQTLACLGQYPFEGHIQLAGEDIQNKSAQELRLLRANQIGMIFQNPQACLNPTMKIGEQIREVNPRLTKDHAQELMRRVKLSDVERCYHSYPFEMSGGMCQRVMIAMAIARKPQLIIADEPTTALDVTIQVQILDLLKELRTSTLLITHDFGVIDRICNRVLVMYAGEIIEQGTVKEILHNPQHPYTEALLNARPKLGKGKNYPLLSIPGNPPELAYQSPGCAFFPRCQEALEICSSQKPPISGSKAACWKRMPNAI